MSVKRFFCFMGAVAALSVAACGGSQDVEWECNCSTTDSSGNQGANFNTVVCADVNSPPQDTATQQCESNDGSSTTCSCACTPGTTECTPK